MRKARMYRRLYLELRADHRALVEHADQLTRENADLLRELRKLGWQGETFESPVIWRPEQFVRIVPLPKCLWCEYRAVYQVAGETLDLESRWVADDGKMFCSAACMEAFYSGTNQQS